MNKYPQYKKCIICNSKVTIEGNLQMQKKTCSYDCWKKNNYVISAKRNNEKVEKTCRKCGTKYQGLKKYLIGKYCKKCQYEIYKERIGKKNPNYKNGLYTHSNFQNRKSKTAYKHLNECRRYRKEFLEKHKYLFCEICTVNANGTPRFEVHHIYYASRVPKHKNLHKNENMILVCVGCHWKFHAEKYKAVFKRLEKERGLKELFNKK